MFKPRFLLLIALALMAVAAGCGGGDKKNVAANGCRIVSQPAARPVENLKAPTLKLDPKKTYIAEFQTNCGNFSIKLANKEQPKTAASFVYLARQKFYDGLWFHRISPAVSPGIGVIQGGDPQGNGQGGPGYTVVEAPPANTEYTAGTVAMAKGGDQPRGASGSQFFIVTAQISPIASDYAVLGQVASGQDVVQKIGLIPPAAGTQDTPSQVVVMEKVRIVEK
jgi:cyclophilin family peptidyl-prolyl cis-trans isomerase